MSRYDYDEKAAYERRRSRNSSRESYDSKASTTSSEKDTPPPPYAYTFYNKVSDKPLPPLPRGRERRVRFLMDKPLPAKPLPALPQDQQKRSSSCEGEYAWWAERRGSGDGDEDVEKEIY
jgi:hypothetical protein